MSRLSGIFDVFSKRSESSYKQTHDIPETFRNRVFIWCNEVFGNIRSGYGGNNVRDAFWHEIHRFLQYSHGRPKLSDGSHNINSRLEDAVAFLIECPGEGFIDFIEYIFHVDCLFQVNQPEQELVAEINQLIRVDGLPYYVTDFVKESEKMKVFPFTEERTVIKTVEYPKVIMKENEVLHSQAVEPALKLLQQPVFKNANAEFIEALEDYRKADYGDCLTKCGSAFESVMKIICDKKGWRYSQTDTANTLVKTILDKTQLESYFESTLMIVATLRNRLSKSHGSGMSNRSVQPHLARYALNATASAMLLLADEAGLQ